MYQNSECYHRSAWRLFVDSELIKNQSVVVARLNLTLNTKASNYDSYKGTVEKSSERRASHRLVHWILCQRARINGACAAPETADYVKRSVVVRG